VIRTDAAVASLPGDGGPDDLREHRGPIEEPHRVDRRRQQTCWRHGAHAAERFHFNLRVATPPQLAPNKSMRTGSSDPGADRARTIGTAVRGADCVVTDTWFSMGDKDGEHRHNLLKPYQGQRQAESLAKSGRAVQHCLPAHRGDEVTDE